VVKWVKVLDGSSGSWVVYFDPLLYQDMAYFSTIYRLFSLQKSLKRHFSTFIARQIRPTTALGPACSLKMSNVYQYYLRLQKETVEVIQEKLFF